MNKRPARNARDAGFSVVELMIALTLSVILVAGLITVFINSKRGYRLQESTGRLQDNARIALTQLADHVRLADLWSSVKPDQVTVLGGPITYGGSCDTTVNASTNWIVNKDDALHGYQGAASVGAIAGLPSGCLDSSYVPDSDVLVLRYADPDQYIPEASLSSTNTTNGKVVLRALVGQSAVLFDITSQLSAAQAALPATGPPDTAQVLNYRYQTVMFHLENHDFGSGPVPTLYMKSLTSSSFTDAPLIDGVEMMKFTYGVDTNGDDVVDSYEDASAVTNWSQVISVRLALLVRGDQIDTLKDTNSYAMTPSYTFTPAATAQSYQRRLFIKEIQVRNRVRG